jgi:hypothetical protein
LKEEVLDRTLWRTRFRIGYRALVRQTTEWMSWYFTKQNMNDFGNFKYLVLWLSRRMAYRKFSFTFLMPDVGTYTQLLLNQRPLKMPVLSVRLHKFYLQTEKKKNI